MKKWIVGFIILIFILMAFYIGLGGFNKVDITIQNTSEINLLGTHFRGLPESENLRWVFQEFENHILQNPSAALYTIYYVEPAGRRDTLEVFVGLESSFLQDQPNLIPKNIPGGKAIVASIGRHRLVMPTPRNIKNKMIAFAESNEYPTPTLFVDKIIGPSEVVVIAPIH